MSDERVTAEDYYFTRHMCYYLGWEVWTYDMDAVRHDRDVHDFECMWEQFIAQRVGWADRPGVGFRIEKVVVPL